MSSDDPSATATTPEQTDRPDAQQTCRPWLFVVFECDRPLSGGLGVPLADLEVVTIGRGAERCADVRGHELDLRLPSSLLSTNHARMRCDGDGWILEDTNSRNGTYVNRRRITQHALRDGDLIELGRVVLRYRVLPHVTIMALPGAPPGFRTLLPTLAVDFAELARIAQSSLPILLLGETGTGKELVARAIHELSQRPGPLVPVNCGALTSSLVESQLFGHVRGAFTGALRDEPGYVRASDGGTLFLDEIGDLPPPAQAALLRVLQERRVAPVGGTREIQVDLRIIAATHHRLDLLSVRGDFRADLFARLSGHTQYLAPLRERREDIGSIVAELLRRLPGGGADLQFSAESGRELVAADWPLNIRQLEQALTRAATLAECKDGSKSGARIVEVRHLITTAPNQLAPTKNAQPGTGPTRVVSPSPDDESRRDELQTLLSRHRGNVSEVARAMGCSRMQIHRWMQKFGIDPASYRR